MRAQVIFGDDARFSGTMLTIFGWNGKKMALFALFGKVRSRQLKTFQFCSENFSANLLSCCLHFFSALSWIHSFQKSLSISDFFLIINSWLHWNEFWKLWIQESTYNNVNNNWVDLLRNFQSKIEMFSAVYS